MSTKGIQPQDESLSLIAATVHELKTPLTLIHGMSAMLESETFGELNFKQREQIRHIAKASRRLGFLAESLLHVENLPYGQRVQPVQVQSELRMVVADLSERAAEREIAINYRPKSLPPVLADTTSVYQVLMHLLASSIKYAPAGSAIGISTHRRGDQVMVRIKDANPGPTPKEAKQIKDTFGKRRQPVRAQGGSAGLSLYIIQSIVEFYEGSLHVSQGTGGSAVSIRLPISNQLSLFDE